MRSSSYLSGLSALSWALLLLLAALAALAAGCGDSTPPATDAGTDTGATGSCEPPEERCGSRCVNTMNDGRNCGSCGFECASGSFCSAGMCSRSCPTATTACGGSCAELSTDRDHCGLCDNACAADEACRGGSCTCPEGYTECDGTCIDPDSDDANCGICGRTCEADQACRMGICTCADSARETECNDGLDDDCDGLVDCDDDDCEGATRSCTGACGAGIETCDGASTWGECAGGSPTDTEICGDGIDQDCDGSDPRNLDSYEPNDDCDSCFLLSPMDDPMLTINARFDSVDDRVDCYRFNAHDGVSVAGPEHIWVDLTDIPDGHDYDVFLYGNYDDCNAASNPLQSGQNFGNTDENLDWTERFGSDDSGTYYIRVTRYRGQSCTDDYTLTVDGLRQPPR